MAENRDAPRQTTFELRDYFRILWTRKWTAFILLALVVGGVMYLSYRQIPIYQSQLELQVIQAPSVQGAANTGEAVNLETEAQVASSEAIAGRVALALDLDVEARQLLRFIQIAPQKGTTILLFRAQHPNPERAAALAEEFAEQYLKRNLKQTLSPFQRALEQARLDKKAAEDELDLLPEPEADEEEFIRDARSRAESKRLIAEGQIRANEEAITRTELESRDAFLSHASVGRKPVRPDHVRDGIFAAIVGLVLGIGAAFLKDYADDSLRGPDDLERQAGASLVGVIPHVSARRNGAKGRQDGYLISLEDPKAPATESYRTLRTNLLFMQVGGPIRRLLITSPIKGEGKTTTASNLASVMALAGQRVLLIGADLRRPSIHKYFDLSNRVGLSSVLSGQATLMEAIQDPGIRGLRVMSGGPVPPNPAELLGSMAMHQLLEQASEAADWVILDGPPVLGLADASVLATTCDAVLMVVNEATNRRVLAHGRDQLAKVRARVVGCVLNNFGPATSYYYYADYYAYTSHYYYEQDDEEKRRKGFLKRRKERKRRREKAKKAAEGNGAAPVEVEDDLEEEEEPALESGRPSGSLFSS